MEPWSLLFSFHECYLGPGQAQGGAGTVPGQDPVPGQSLAPGAGPGIAPGPDPGTQYSVSELLLALKTKLLQIVGLRSSKYYLNDFPTCLLEIFATGHQGGTVAAAARNRPHHNWQ